MQLSLRVHGTRRLSLVCQRHHGYVTLGKPLNLPGPQFVFPREEKGREGKGGAERKGGERREEYIALASS